MLGIEGKSANIIAIDPISGLPLDLNTLFSYWLNYTSDSFSDSDGLLRTQIIY